MTDSSTDRITARPWHMAAMALVLAGCGPSGEKKATYIQNKGSDTVVNVAQAWAEQYKTVAPDVEVEVSGGGSGVGIAALIRGAIDIANASRDIKPQEIEQVKKNTGRDPKGFVAGYDALAIYVHRDNPLDEISIGQLADIFAEGLIKLVGSHCKPSYMNVAWVASVVKHHA